MPGFAGSLVLMFLLSNHISFALCTFGRYS